MRSKALDHSAASIVCSSRPGAQANQLSSCAIRYGPLMMSSVGSAEEPLSCSSLFKFLGGHIRRPSRRHWPVRPCLSQFQVLLFALI